MPVSSDYSILFIHIPKNAGKSVGRALGVYVGNSSKRTLINRAAIFVVRATQKKESRRRLLGMVDASLYGPHMTLREIMVLDLIPSVELSQMIKVAVCRNPYDRAVSIFHHMGVGYEKSPRGFRSFWREWPNKEAGGLRSAHNLKAFRRNQWEFCVNQDGLNGVDYVLRYERLREDLENLCGSLLLSRVPLSWEGNNRTTRTYAWLYDKETKSLIENIYERDFDFFGYSRNLDE